MKVSRYNVYIPLKERYIVYNTLRETVVVVDEDLKERLKTSKLELLDDSVRKGLLQCGIVVSDDINERAFLQYRYEVAKYSAEYINVLLLPTYACNLSCHYCPTPKQPIFMDTETAENVIAFLTHLVNSTNLGVVLKLYGGEPLLHADCCSTLCEALSSFCQSRNLIFLAAAMTNGTLLTHEKTEKLLPYLGALHVTLDGSLPYHNSIRHYADGGGTYGDIMKGLSLARERGTKISVRINTTPENLGSIKELLDDLKEYKFHKYDKFEIYFGPIAPLGDCTYYEDDTLSKKFKEDAYRLAPSLREVVRAAGWEKNARDLVTDMRSVSKPEQCQYGKAYNFVIDPQGTLYTCPAFVGDPAYCTGTLTKEGAEFTSLYYDIHTRNPMGLECASCEYLPVCGGGCPVRAYMKTKTVDSHYCGSSRELPHNLTLLYLQESHPELFGG